MTRVVQVEKKRHSQKECRGREGGRVVESGLVQGGNTAPPLPWYYHTLTY